LKFSKFQVLSVLLSVLLVSSIVPNSFALADSSVSTKSEVPDWLKNNAGWWAEGKISEGEFLNGLEYLISKKIIKLSDTIVTNNSSDKVPSWIKNNAGWWSQNQISDDDFIKGIEHLVNEGLIHVEHENIHSDKTSAIISSKTGATIQSSDGKLTLEFPAGAVSEEVKVSVKIISHEEFSMDVEELDPNGTIYSLEPDGLQFKKAVKVTLEVDNVVEELDEGFVVNSPKVRLMSSNGDTSDDFSSDIKDGKAIVTGEIHHFSYLMSMKPHVTLIVSPPSVSIEPHSEFSLNTKIIHHSNDNIFGSGVTSSTLDGSFKYFISGAVTKEFQKQTVRLLPGDYHETFDKKFYCEKGGGTVTVDLWYRLVDKNNKQTTNSIQLVVVVNCSNGFLPTPIMNFDDGKSSSSSARFPESYSYTSPNFSNEDVGSEFLVTLKNAVLSANLKNWNVKRVVSIMEHNYEGPITLVDDDYGPKTANGLDTKYFFNYFTCDDDGDFGMFFGVENKWSVWKNTPKSPSSSHVK